MSNQTVAVILGASQWPKSPDVWPDSPLFKNSAEGFLRYLLAPHGLNLSSKDVLDLFDDTRSQSESVLYATLEGTGWRGRRRRGDARPRNSDGKPRGAAPTAGAFRALAATPRGGGAELFGRK